MTHSLPMYAGICLCLYFSYHTYYGERSQARLYALSVSLEQKTSALQKLEKDGSMLEERVSMLRPQTLSRDLVEQQARYMLGFTETNETVIVDN